MYKSNLQKPQKDHELRDALLQLLVALISLVLMLAPIVLLLWWLLGTEIMKALLTLLVIGALLYSVNTSIFSAILKFLFRK